MSKPAARVGDPTQHLAVPLAPGPGAAAGGAVMIEHAPAWRALVDVHVCPMPIAPPSPAPHAAEKCVAGSFSVLINLQMAVRAGDNLIGLGPPNVVVRGATSVLIGDLPFGLLDASNTKEFCAEFAKIKKDWDKMTPDQRRAALATAANRQLGKSGVPPVGINSVPFAQATRRGELNFQTWSLDINSSLLGRSTLTSAEARGLANTVYHESRHAEQWFSMARVQAAAPGASAGQLAAATGMPPSVVTSAMRSPLRLNESPQAVFGAAMNRSVYGADGNYRNDVLRRLSSSSRTQTTYDQYRALPEEADAWKTGDATDGCGC